MPAPSTLAGRLAAAAAAGLLLLAGCGGGGSPAPVGLRPLAARDGNKQILIVGGSVMRQTGVALEAALAEAPWVAVHNASASDVVGFGETGVVNLQAQWAALVEQYRPDVVLVQITVSRPRFHCEGPEAGRCLEEGLRYHVEVAMKDMVDTLSRHGAQVVWVQFPVFAPEVENHELLDQFNQLVADYAKLDSRLTLVRSSDVVDPGGTFTYWLDTPAGYRQVRKSDGMHLCPYGAELIAADLAAKLVKGWSSGAGPWVLGSWRRDQRFVSEQPALGVTACDDSIHETRPPDPVRDVPAPPPTAPSTTLPPVTVP